MKLFVIERRPKFVWTIPPFYTKIVFNESRLFSGHCNPHHRLVSCISRTTTLRSCLQTSLNILLPNALKYDDFGAGSLNEMTGKSKMSCEGVICSWFHSEEGSTSMMLVVPNHRLYTLFNLWPLWIIFFVENVNLEFKALNILWPTDLSCWPVELGWDRVRYWPFRLRRTTRCLGRVNLAHCYIGEDEQVASCPASSWKCLRRHGLWGRHPNCISTIEEFEIKHFPR